jgi:hypothetical protein
LSRNVSVGLEYDYFRLDGSATGCVQSNSSVLHCGGPLPLKYADIDTDAHQVVVRLNYKFGERDEYTPLK